ncbi:MAG: hypothetical protein VKK59_07630 [Vampirovibrionales bacterium]|nr:hypothetical protein [Vampirovibrionales bacterium]
MARLARVVHRELDGRPIDYKVFPDRPAETSYLHVRPYGSDELCVEFEHTPLDRRYFNKNTVDLKTGEVIEPGGYDTNHRMYFSDLKIENPIATRNALIRTLQILLKKEKEKTSKLEEKQI